jgi:hypothetical protein
MSGLLSNGSLANRANLGWQRDPEESVPLPVSVPRGRELGI